MDCHHCLFKYKSRHHVHCSRLYNSHTSDHGLPNTVHSDKGSQLVAAGNEVVNFEWDIIARRTSVHGTKWVFAPAGAQWRNGAIEIFVKKIKKSFHILYSKT